MISHLVRQVRADVKNVQHDMFLLYLIPLPIIVSLIFPVVFQMIDGFFGTVLDIGPYYLLFTKYVFLVLSPMLWGTVFGFLIINEKDLRTLDFIRVTPAGLNRLVHFRIASGAILSMISEVFSFLLLGIELDLELLVLIVSASLFSPIMMLGIVILASNKVQAFALMKGMSSIFVLPFFYLIVPSAEFLFTIVPPYWIAKPLVNDLNGSETDPLVLLIGVASQLLWTILLQKLFVRKLKQ